MLVQGASSPPRSLPGEDALTLVHRPTRPRARPVFSAADALFLAEWPALRLAALLPERRWAGIALGIERWKARFGGPPPARLAPRIRRPLGLPDDASAEAIAWATAAGRTEHHIQVVRATSPRGWHPEIATEGLDHLEDALAAGRGAVLWMAHFCFAPLVVKIGLQRAGMPLSHLSRPEHGFSSSAFGIRVLNPLRCRAEERHLKRRIVIESADPGRAVRAAREALLANEAVSITAGAWEGHRLVSGPLLGGRFQLATGAPRLAHATGAALLPVFATRPAPEAPFRLRIGPPLPLAADARGAIRAATTAFLAETEREIRAAPAQWRGWSHWLPPEEPA
jgi:lauroyl/myristoyl acyltransferase